MSRTYLITAATGIGAETARILTRRAAGGHGVQIFFSSLADEPCIALQKELQDLGAAVGYYVGDLTDANVSSQIVNACVARFQRIDGLFNVAGISGRRFGDGPIHTCTEAGWQRTLETNLTTQFRMCHHVVNVMLRQDRVHGERGAILNMSSILALHPEPTHFDTVAYAASKGGILSMTRSMAASYASEGIRVNAILPALVRTPMSERASQDAEVVEFVRRKQRLVQDILSTERVASSCAFLLGTESSATTGQWIEVDGGWGL